MEESLDFINHVLRSRLRQWEIRQFLQSSAPPDPEGMLDYFSKLIDRFGAMLYIARHLDAALPLEMVLKSMMTICTEATNSERGSVFIFDARTCELFSRAMAGTGQAQEIRFPSDRGIAGRVFKTGQPLIIPDAYADPAFNPEIDRVTGLRTRNILCVPIRTPTGDVVGVVQVLNRRSDTYSMDDEIILEVMASQASAVLIRSLLNERVEAAREQEKQIHDIVTAISRELELRPLLTKIVKAATELLTADRSTVFLHDMKTHQLFSFLAEGLSEVEIRIPENAGLAGTCFSCGKPLNIPDAYADPRFNQQVDRETGYRTRNVLCMPIRNREDRCLGVVQVINKSHGTFHEQDERRLQAFAAQVAIAIENATNFEEMRNMRNYNESILESMSSGVLTLAPDGLIQKWNRAFLRLFETTGEQIAGLPASDYFTGENGWVLGKIKRIKAGHPPDITMDSEIALPGKARASVNLTAVPLTGTKSESLGTMLVFEDITREKRLKSTMARYMAKELADKLLGEGETALGGRLQKATVLFSDVRQFTSLTERLGAQETVQLLNEYFSIMVDCILSEQGILDKFIGDALMAVFGVPFQRADDADRAVQASLRMFRGLRDFNARRASENKPPIRMGVGINTGELVSGNIGSLKRMEYTVIGDHVNLGARLETLSKQYGVSFLISEFTADALQRKYLMRKVDHVIVLGKSQPVRVYQVFDDQECAEMPRLPEMLALFSEALVHYHGRDWVRARTGFKAALDLHPADKLCNLYIGRCDQFLAEPPPMHWDGVWVARGK
jgi:adenylate cyclase